LPTNPTVRPLFRPTPSVRLIALTLWVAALAYLSLAPEVSAPGGVRIWDKFSHFTAYAVLAVLLIRVLALRRRLDVWWLLSAWLLCFSYGLLLEGLQGWMALGRQFEGGDLLANALGALAGCALFCRNAVGSSQ